MKKKKKTWAPDLATLTALFHGLIGKQWSHAWASFPFFLIEHIWCFTAMQWITRQYNRNPFTLVKVCWMGFLIQLYRWLFKELWLLVWNLSNLTVHLSTRGVYRKAFRWGHTWGFKPETHGWLLSNPASLLQHGGKLPKRTWWSLYCINTWPPKVLQYERTV